MYGDLERAASATPLGCAKLMVLQRDELSANVRPTPAVATLRFPAIVIGRRAAHVDHAVDRTGAADGFTLEPQFGGHAFTARGLVIPYMRVAGHQQFADPARHGDQWTGMVGAAFDEQYRNARVGG